MTLCKSADGFEAIVARYGSPHLWTTFEWWINAWRLIAEYIEIRVIIDVATRCPDEELRKQAADKLRGEFEVARLDHELPGRHCFEYDWEGLARIRDARKVIGEAVP